MSIPMPNMNSIQTQKDLIDCLQLTRWMGVLLSFNSKPQIISTFYPLVILFVIYVSAIIGYRVHLMTSQIYGIVLFVLLMFCGVGLIRIIIEIQQLIFNLSLDIFNELNDKKIYFYIILLTIMILRDQLTQEKQYKEDDETNKPLIQKQQPIPQRKSVLQVKKK